MRESRRGWTKGGGYAMRGKRLRQGIDSLVPSTHEFSNPFEQGHIGHHGYPFGSYSLICNMRLVPLLVFIAASVFTQAQVWDHFSHQPPDDFTNVHVKKIHSDSSQSTFIIWVKESVKPHFHAEHTEFLYVLDGEAEMVLGDSTFSVKGGDFFIIPKGTIHSVRVTGSEPLKVISIQTPEFHGTDRIWVDE